MFGKFIVGFIAGAAAIIIYAEKKGLEVAFKLKEDLGHAIDNARNGREQR